MVPPFLAKDVLYNARLQDWQAIDQCHSLRECEEGKQAEIREIAEFVAANKLPVRRRLKPYKQTSALRSAMEVLKGP
jgi:hypothetical protein